VVIRCQGVRLTLEIRVTSIKNIIYT